MSIKSPAVQTPKLVAFPLQGRPLGRADQSFIATAMAEIAAGWSVELAETTLIIVPSDGDDAVGPSFMICREAYGFRLSQVHWDALTEVGVFASLHDVLEMLRGRLAFCPCLLSTPSSVTLH